MTWALIPQAFPVLPPSRVRLQIMRDANSRRKLLGVLLSREVALATGMKDGDAITLHIGQGQDVGWLRFDLTGEALDACTLVAVPGSTNSTVKFNLPEDAPDATASCKAPIWEARPGSLFIRVPAGLKGLSQMAVPATPAQALAGDGKVPLYGCGKVEPQEDLAPPPAVGGELVLEVSAPAEPEPSPDAPPPAASAMAPLRRGPAEVSPDRLKPDAMAHFAAGLGARAVADQLRLTLSLVSRWKEEFDLSRKGAVKRRAA